MSKEEVAVTGVGDSSVRVEMTAKSKRVAANRGLLLFHFWNPKAHRFFQFQTGSILT